MGLCKIVGIFVLFEVRKDCHQCGVCRESKAFRHDSTVRAEGYIKFDIDGNASPPPLHFGPQNEAPFSISNSYGNL